MHTADFLFMFEGMAQGGLGANWGDGHATDADLMNLVRALDACIVHRYAVWVSAC